MASAGSVQCFQSLQDLTNTAEQDIYVEPDQTIAALLLSHPLTPPPPTAPPTCTAKNYSKPATLPKPQALGTRPASSHDQPDPPSLHPNQVTPSSSRSPSRLSPIPTPDTDAKEGQSSPKDRSEGEESEDDYVSPKVFKEDLQQQSQVSTTESYLGMGGWVYYYSSRYCI